MRRTLLALTLCAWAVSPTFAVAPVVADAAQAVAPVVADAAQAVAEEMEEARRHKGSFHEKVSAASPLEVLAELRKYINDPDKRVRIRALDLAGWVSHQKHTTRNVRQQAIRFFLDVASTNLDGDTRDDAVRSLTGFSRADFTGQMRQEIYQLLQKSPSGNLALLAGVADVRAAAPQLRKLADSGNWNAQLALARMGDPMAIQYVIAKVEGVENRPGRLDKPLHYLAFIRQPQAVEVLLKYLFSDERTAPSPPDVGSSPHASFAFDELKGIIEGFPDGIAGRDVLIARARQWVAQQVAQQIAPQPAATAGQQAPATIQTTRSGGVANLKIKR